MGYYVSNIIGIRLSDVFGRKTDMEDLKLRVAKIVKEMNDINDDFVDIDDDPSHCLSKELVASKGGYAVIAGVFNHWTYNFVEKFVKRLSEEFGTEIMVMSWDEQTDDMKCNIFFDGKPRVKAYY